MAKKLMDKVMGIIGFDDEVVDEEEFEEEDNYREEENRFSSRNKKGQVVKLHSQRQVRVIVVEPELFDEVQGIAENIKNRCPVVVNLENADSELARRVIDFISGAAYALGGNVQKVGSGIFLCVPSNMDISNELRDQLKTKKATFDWLS